MAEAAAEKVLLVTGASRGIGAEICRRAAQGGWAVAVNYASSKQEAEDVCAAIASAGGTAIPVQANVSESEQVARMFAEIDEKLGSVTGLVNNAGANGGGTRVDDQEPEATFKVFAVNAIGPFFCAREAIRRMAKRHGGTGGAIVNIGSAASKHGGPGSYIDYAASKGALDVFTVGLAKEQASEGIRVNTLRPGITMTELSKKYASEHPDWVKWVMEQVPLGRAGEPMEMADAALWLLSDEAAYVTGATLDVSGGWVSP